MGSEWRRFYERSFSLKDYLTNLSSHAPLFEEIIREKPKKILEVGIGTGSMSIFLSHLGYDVVGIDNAERILLKAVQLNKKLNGNAKFCLCDAFKLSDKFAKDEFDVVFSQGFLEHFNDDEIKNLISEQLKVGNVILFSVPSNFYPIKDFGNERLLSADEWSKILECFTVKFIKYYGLTYWGVKLLVKGLLKSPKRPILKTSSSIN